MAGYWGANRSDAERCRQQSDRYMSYFPEIPVMRSSDLIEERRRRQQEDTGPPLHLVDVRTAAEQAVSVIPGSVALDEWERAVVPTIQEESVMVVTYCTIGYRSGMEARRLRNRHANWTVYNLDGIVSYTHAAAAAAVNDHETSSSSNSAEPLLIDRCTGEATTAVHTFGPQWSFVDRAVFHPTHFAAPALMLQMSRVGGITLVRSTQNVYHQSKRLMDCASQKQDDSEELVS